MCCLNKDMIKCPLVETPYLVILVCLAMTARKAARKLKTPTQSLISLVTDYSSGKSLFRHTRVQICIPTIHPPPSSPDYRSDWPSIFSLSPHLLLESNMPEPCFSSEWATGVGVITLTGVEYCADLEGELRVMLGLARVHRLGFPAVGDTEKWRQSVSWWSSGERITAEFNMGAPCPAPDSS